MCSCIRVWLQLALGSRRGWCKPVCLFWLLMVASQRLLLLLVAAAPATNAAYTAAADGSQLAVQITPSNYTILPSTHAL